MEGGGKDKRIIVLVDHEALDSLAESCMQAWEGPYGALVGGTHDESSEGVKIF